METACGNLIKWLLDYESFKSYLWSGQWIGVGFEQKLLLMPVYVSCPVYLYLTFDPNDPDEPYAEVIISILPILICSLFKY